MFSWRILGVAGTFRGMALRMEGVDCSFAVVFVALV